MSIPHQFANPALLDEALTHASLAADGVDNQRLEFLGDAVLQIVVSEWLHELHRGWNAGQLTKARARLVNTGTLALLADEWQLASALRMAKGERKGNVARNVKVRADAFEAVVAAIYLDAGLKAVRGAVLPLFVEALSRVETLIDARSLLLQWSQKHKVAPPVYRDVGSEGEAHARTFYVEIELAGRRFGPASAGSKQAARAAAATVALDGLGIALSDD